MERSHEDCRARGRAALGNQRGAGRPQRPVRKALPQRSGGLHSDAKAQSAQRRAGCKKGVVHPEVPGKLPVPPSARGPREGSLRAAATVAAATTRATAVGGAAVGHGPPPAATARTSRSTARAASRRSRTRRTADGTGGSGVSTCARSATASNTKASSTVSIPLPEIQPALVPLVHDSHVGEHRWLPRDRGRCHECTSRSVHHIVVPVRRVVDAVPAAPRNMPFKGEELRV